MKIKDIMNTKPATVQAGATMEELACALAHSPYRLLHVVDGAGRLQGIVSSLDILSVLAPFYLDSDLARSLADDDAVLARALKENAGKTAKELMRSDVVALKPGDPLVEAEVLFRERGFNTLPVLDESGKLVGEASRRDILKAVVKRCCNCQDAGK